MKKFLISIGVISLVAVIAGIWTNASAAVLGQGSRNCTSTAVVKCGAFSQSELNSRMTASSRALYNNMGISTSLSGAKDGIVRANGNVEVNGKVVATGAQVIGATAYGGGTQFKVGGYTFRKHSANEALRGDDAHAYIFFNSDGTFKNAIIKICGNPVTAKVVPKPSAQCDALSTPVITNRTNVALKATASTKNGATISKYTFTVVNSNSKTVATKAVSTKATTASTSVNITTPGTYTAKVVVKTSEGNKTATACAKKFTIKEADAPGVSIDKTVNGVEKTTVEVNEEFTYELVVKNTGNTDLENVKVEDVAPTGVTFLSADKGEISNNAWTYTVPEIKKGGSVNVKITAVIKEYIESAVINKACVDAPTVPGNPDDCDEAEVEVPPKPEPGKDTVCELETKKIITIGEDEFDSNKHSRDLADCDEIPVVPETPETPETPEETPPELPQTGANDLMIGGLGLGALVTTTIAYVISRRNLIG